MRGLEVHNGAYVSWPQSSLWRSFQVLQPRREGDGNRGGWIDGKYWVWYLILFAIKSLSSSSFPADAASSRLWYMVPASLEICQTRGLQIAGESASCWRYVQVIPSLVRSLWSNRERRVSLKDCKETPLVVFVCLWKFIQQCRHPL